MFISLVMFLIFGSFLGGLSLLGPFWPLLLIVLGLGMLAWSFLRPHVPGGSPRMGSRPDVS